MRPPARRVGRRPDLPRTGRRPDRISPEIEPATGASTPRNSPQPLLVRAAVVLGGQVPVREGHDGLVPVRLQDHLDRAAARREVVPALDAPGEDDTVRRVDLDVGAPGRVALHVDGEDAARARHRDTPLSAIHLIANAGSVKYGNTTSGGAAMRTLAMTGGVAVDDAPLSLLVFG